MGQKTNGRRAVRCSCKVVSGVVGLLLFHRDDGSRVVFTILGRTVKMLISFGPEFCREG